MTAYSTSELRNKIKDYPKKNLIQCPTPFHKLENLSRILGGPQIYVKRDDLTGLAFGGNKSRKLEYIIQDILDKGADVVVTWAALQSNWCLQTAAAAKKYGIKPILVLFKTYDLPEEYDGNLLMNYLLGVDIRIRDAEKGQLIREEDAEELIADVISEVKQKATLMRARQSTSSALQSTSESNVDNTQLLDDTFDRWEINISEAEMAIDSHDAVDLMEHEFIVSEQEDELRHELATLLAEEAQQ